MIMLAVEADDEQRASVTFTGGLAGRESRRLAALRGDITNALAKTAMAEFVGTAEIVDRVVSGVGSETRLHGAVVLVAEGQDVHPHRQRV